MRNWYKLFVVLFVVIIAIGATFMAFSSASGKIDGGMMKILVILDGDGRLGESESRITIYLDSELLASAHIKCQPVDVMGDEGELESRRIRGNVPLIIAVHSSLLRRYSNLKIVDEELHINASVLTSAIADGAASEVIFCRIKPNDSEYQWGIATRSAGGKYSVLGQ